MLILYLRGLRRRKCIRSCGEYDLRWNFFSRHHRTINNCTLNVPFVVEINIVVLPNLSNFLRSGSWLGSNGFFWKINFSKHFLYLPGCINPLSKSRAVCENGTYLASFRGGNGQFSNFFSFFASVLQYIHLCMYMYICALAITNF